ncbi:hypothetical protein [Sorangium sp. So ce381]|uniref:hypothetical protein n=1 Tax=Sorangium sp. So ce381 TaxID=3133307 RepID=UPI003F5B9002
MSESDEGEPDWDQKLARYRASGIREVVRFHPDDRERPIRVWDAHDGDLVERTSADPELRACEALGLWWTVVDDPSVGPMLRLARDREGHDLLPTPDEAERAVRAPPELVERNSALSSAGSREPRSAASRAITATETSLGVSSRHAPRPVFPSPMTRSAPPRSVRSAVSHFVQVVSSVCARVV